MRCVCLLMFEFDTHTHTKVERENVCMRVCEAHTHTHTHTHTHMIALISSCFARCGNDCHAQDYNFFNEKEFAFLRKGKQKVSWCW